MVASTYLTTAKVGGRHLGAAAAMDIGRAMELLPCGEEEKKRAFCGGSFSIITP